MLKHRLASSRQLLLVVSKKWDTPEAELAAYERSGPEDPWRAVRSRVPAMTGRSGLGWGSGLHGREGVPGPIKREGDNRAPAGVFRIGHCFGYAPREDAQFLSLPYLASGEGWECIDDIRSTHYNRIVRKSHVPRPDWSSSEEMVLKDHRYRWGCTIEHNTEPTRPGSGSCVFLHIWLNPSTPTAGCTALEEADLLEILRWLRPEAHPVIVQLPREDYERLKGTWGLP